MKIFVAAEAAREVLGEGRRPDMDVLAVVNTLTAEKAVRNLESINEEKRRELWVLSTEPAIARIVAEDEHGKLASRLWQIHRRRYREMGQSGEVRGHQAFLGELKIDWS